MRGILLFATLALTAIGGAIQAAPNGRADLVFLHGHVLTVDAEDRVVQAIAIKGNRIMAVGSDAEILALAGAGTRLIELRGRSVTPGLIDTHAHIAEGGFDELFAIDLKDAGSIADIADRVAAQVPRLAPGEWIYGSGWDEGKLSDGRLPSAADLDRVSPDNPVWLLHTTGHYGVANNLALKLADITRDTKDPPASTIDRAADGTPTGVLKEQGAMTLVSRLLPPPSPGQRRAAILHEVEVLHREGITAVKDPAIEQATWDAYRGLVQEGKLQERVCVLWRAGATLESAHLALTQVLAAPRLPGSLGDQRLLSCGVKIFMDGSGGGRTAWSYKAWNRQFTETDDDNRGYPALDPQLYRAMVDLFHRAGVPIGTHAVGDRAIDWVVDSYARALAETPIQGLRHSIIHANGPTEHALDTVAMLQHDFDAGYLEMQPTFLWWIGDTYAGNYGPERSATLLPLKTLADRHILWSSGSDFPVTPVAARYGLWAEVERKTLKGLYGTQPFGTSESIDIHTALKSYTRWSAPQMFLEHEIGSLEPGKRADLAVWSQDPYSMAADSLKDLQCEMTVLDGAVVYRAPGTMLTEITVP